MRGPPRAFSSSTLPTTPARSPWQAPRSPKRGGLEEHKEGHEEHERGEREEAQGSLASLMQLDGSDLRETLVRANRHRCSRHHHAPPRVPARPAVSPLKRRAQSRLRRAFNQAASAPQLPATPVPAPAVTSSDDDDDEPRGQGEESGAEEGEEEEGEEEEGREAAAAEEDEDEDLEVRFSGRRDSSSYALMEAAKRPSGVFPRRRSSVQALVPRCASPDSAVALASSQRFAVTAEPPPPMPLTRFTHRAAPAAATEDATPATAYRSVLATPATVHYQRPAEKGADDADDDDNDDGSLRPPSPFVQREVLTALRESARRPELRPARSPREGLYALYHDIQEWRGEHVHERPPSSISLFVANCDAMQLPPSAKAVGADGLALGVGKARSIDLRYDGFGDLYGCALSSTLALRPDVNRLDLRENRLTAHSVAAILPQLHHHLTALDLGSNTVGLDGALLLGTFLRRSVSLLELGLSAAQLGDAAGEQLFAALQSNGALTRLDVSRNDLGARSMAQLAAVLSGGKSALAELSLAWNAVRGSAAHRLMAGLVENSRLTALDLSWNAIGDAVAGLGSALELHPRLRHLDLSHNSLDRVACRTLAKALTGNHALLGLHLDGCPAYVDERGFVVTHVDDEHPPYPLQARVPAQESRVFSASVAASRSHDSRCWVCDHWTATTLAWYPTRSGPMGHELGDDGKPEAVYVHCEFDGWLPRLLNASLASKGRLQAAVVAPPGRLQFVFSDGVSRVMCAADQVSVAADERAAVLGVPVPAVNVVHLRRHPELAASARARMALDGSGDNGGKIGAWSFARSVFSTFRQDTDLKLKMCLNADWLHTKIDRFVPADELESTKKTLLRYYADIREIFRYYAALANSMDVFTVGLNAFSDLMQRCVVPEGDVCNITDLDTIFISSKTLSDRSLMRFQFLEALVRVAVAKFIRTEREEAVPAAVDRLMTDHLLQYAERFSPNEFRMGKLYREEVDALLAGKKEALRLVYAQFSSKKGPTLPPDMSVAEYARLLERAGLTDDWLSSRELKFSFVLSLQTVADEVSSSAASSHTTMEFVEFLEALGRVADTRVRNRAQRSGAGLAEVEEEEEDSAADDEEEGGDGEKKDAFTVELENVIDRVLRWFEKPVAEGSTKAAVPRTLRRPAPPRKAAGEVGKQVGVFVRKAADLNREAPEKLQDWIAADSVWG